MSGARHTPPAEMAGPQFSSSELVATLLRPKMSVNGLPVSKRHDRRYQKGALCVGAESR